MFELKRGAEWEGRDDYRLSNPFRRVRFAAKIASELNLGWQSRLIPRRERPHISKLERNESNSNGRPSVGLVKIEQFPTFRVPARLKILLAERHSPPKR